MKKTITLFILFFLTISFLYGQNTKVTGQILDTNNKGVPYASIEISSLKIGTISDSLGFFNIEFPSEKIENSIRFSALGFKESETKIKSLLETKKNKITLETKIFPIEQIDVPKKRIIKEFGSVKGKAIDYIYGAIGLQQGIFIKNGNGVTGYLESISIYIGKEGYPNCPFRIRIYEFDKENRMPKNDLLNENLIVKNNGEGGNWVTIDLSDYYIKFPPNGVVIAMQWINNGTDQFYEVIRKDLKRSRGKDYKPAVRYGPTLGMIKNEENHLWGRYLGNPWFYAKFNRNVMIKANISFAELK